MTDLKNNSTGVKQIIALLSHYGFDLQEFSANELADVWLAQYHEHWVRLAVIEALYQGRYKAISIEQILTFWARRQHPTFHFNHEFERLICRKLPRHLGTIATPLSKRLDSPIPTYQPNSISRSATKPVLDIPEEIDSPIPPYEPTPISPPLTELESQSEYSSPPVEPPTELPRNEVTQPSINQFTPAPDATNFCQKLKAVAQFDEQPSDIAQKLSHSL